MAPIYAIWDGLADTDVGNIAGNYLNMETMDRLDGSQVPDHVVIEPGYADIWNQPSTGEFHGELSESGYCQWSWTSPYVAPAGGEYFGTDFVANGGAKFPADCTVYRGLYYTGVSGTAASMILSPGGKMAVDSYSSVNFSDMTLNDTTVSASGSTTIAGVVGAASISATYNSVVLDSSAAVVSIDDTSFINGNVRGPQINLTDASYISSSAFSPIDATNVRSGVGYYANYEWRTGVLQVPEAGQVISGVGFGANATELTGTVILPSEDSVLSGADFGADGSQFHGNLTLPNVDQVWQGNNYGPGGNAFSGEFNATLLDPEEVQDSVQYIYGPNTYTGTYAGGTGEDPMAKEDLDAGESIEITSGDGKVLLGTLTPTKETFGKGIGLKIVIDGDLAKSNLRLDVFADDLDETPVIPNVPLRGSGETLNAYFTVPVAAKSLYLKLTTTSAEGGSAQMTEAWI